MKEISFHTIFCLYSRGTNLLTPGLGAENYLNVLFIRKTITPCSQNLENQVILTELRCINFSLWPRVEQGCPKRFKHNSRVFLCNWQTQERPCIWSTVAPPWLGSLSDPENSGQLQPRIFHWIYYYVITYNIIVVRTDILLVFCVLVLTFKLEFVLLILTLINTYYYYYYYYYHHHHHHHYYPCYHLYAGYLQLYTWNKPCF